MTPHDWRFISVLSPDDLTGFLKPFSMRRTGLDSFKSGYYQCYRCKGYAYIGIEGHATYEWFEDCDKAIIKQVNNS